MDWGWHVYLKVKAIGVDDIVVDNLDVDTTLLSGRHVLDELPQLRTADAVGAVHRQRAVDLHAPHDSLEGLGKLLIVALFRRLAIFILRTQSVLAADDIV